MAFHCEGCFPNCNKMMVNKVTFVDLGERSLPPGIRPWLNEYLVFERNVRSFFDEYKTMEFTLKVGVNAELSQANPLGVN